MEMLNLSKEFVDDVKAAIYAEYKRNGSLILGLAVEAEEADTSDEDNVAVSYTVIGAGIPKARKQDEENAQSEE